MGRLTTKLSRTYLNRIVTPVIVQAKPGSYQEVRAQLMNVVPSVLRSSFSRPRLFQNIQMPFTQWKEIPGLNMLATALTSNLIDQIAQMDMVDTVYPDTTKFAFRYPTVPEAGVFTDFQHKPFTTTFWVKRLLGLDRANSQGFDGRGIRTVVLDTGCRVDLPQVRHVKVQTAMPEKGGTGTDANGHGTWCNSCVGGRQAVDPRYNAPVEGMAPQADLFSIQVLGFILGFGTTSDVLEGMQMALQLGTKVVSMSLGSEDSPADVDNPEALAVKQLTQNGAIVVVAAGNSGPGSQTVGSPGSVSDSLTVGALDPLTGDLAKFSSRGPTDVDGYIKPDVSSYGVRMDSQIAGIIDDMVDPSQARYAPISGTSMATPTVAGLVACMAQLYRSQIGIELTTDEVKTMMSAKGRVKNNDDGWGLISWDIVEDWVSNQYDVTL